MRAAEAGSYDGGCTCGGVRYRMCSAPLVVHGCHCRYCQRETGGACAVNALIEKQRLSVLAGEPKPVETPTASGVPQVIFRCPVCQVAVWSVYGGFDPVRFVRVGTLDDPDRFPPDIHIYTSSRQPWVAIPEGVPAVPEYYRADEVWKPESLERRAAYLPGLPKA